MNKKLLALGAATVAAVGGGGLLLIKEHEGLRTTTYLDPIGIPTVCYGHTGKYAVRGRSYTKAQCETILRVDVDTHTAGLNRCVTRKLNQNQSDALISFAFNLGVGATCKSTLVRQINAGNMRAAADQFPRWVYAGGRKFNGLVRRRYDERALFLAPQGPPQNVTVRFNHLAQ